MHYKCNTVAKVEYIMATTKKNNTYLIQEIITKANGALSHAEIQDALENKCNRVTVYRILDKLIEEGTIHKIIDVDGISKFANCLDCKKEHHNHEHIHFSCTKCNTVSCLENVGIHFELPNTYKVEKMNFTLSGVCPECK